VRPPTPAAVSIIIIIIIIIINNMQQLRMTVTRLHNTPQTENSNFTNFKTANLHGIWERFPWGSETKVTVLVAIISYIIHFQGIFFTPRCPNFRKTLPASSFDHRCKNVEIKI